MATAGEAADQEERTEGWQNLGWSSGGWCCRWLSHDGVIASKAWRGGKWKKGAWAPQGDKSACKALAEVDLTEVNKNKEEVINECREHMGSPGNGKLLLCKLGVALSQGARVYLKKTHQGLKSFLSQYPAEFSMDGAKGRESISYLPALARGGQDSSDLPADKGTAASMKASGEEDGPAKGEACAAGLEADGRKKSGGAGVVPREAKDFGKELLAQRRYWCPVCSRGFAKWSQCRQHISATACRDEVLGVNGPIDDEALQKRCKTRPGLQ